MASPEQAEGPDPESEKASLPYYQAARFRAELAAGRVYEKAQALIFTHEECDLSAFRFQLEQDWVVTVLGDQPAKNLHQKIELVLSAGEPASLPSQLLKFLRDRRAKAARDGSWVERHYRSR